MDAETFFAVAASSWAIVMGLSPVLQIRAILARGSSQGVSIAYFGVLLVGFVLWIAYGVAIDNLALIVPNCVAAAVSIATIAIALRFRAEPVTKR